MAGYKVTIGNVDVISLSDGRLEFAVKDFFPSVPAEVWEPYRDQLTPDGKAVMNVGSFLVRSDGKTALVDTGLGESPQGLSFSAVYGLLMKDMLAKGIRPDEIDIVAITHLHRDHVGWNIVNGAPAFPRARYWIPRADWDVFTRGAGMSGLSYIKEVVLPLQALGVLELFEGERALTSELSALPTPGHTAGHTSYLISSQGEKGVILGDASHVPAQAQETDWSPRADKDPALSAQSRRAVMERMERERGLVIGGHYPSPGFGRLVRLKGRRYWKAL